MRQSDISNQQSAISNVRLPLMFIASGIEAVMNGFNGGDPVTIE
jgi:hypothetical protein